MPAFENAFQTLLRDFVHANMLKHNDYTKQFIKQFIFATDGSNIENGSVLMKIWDKMTFLLLFFLQCFSLRVAGTATPDLAATHLDPPTQIPFCLNEVPNGFNQDSQ